MLRNYDISKKVVLTVMRDNRNRAIVLSPWKRKNVDDIDLVPVEEVPLAYQFREKDDVQIAPQFGT
jgi:hypothetical protein